MATRRERGMVHASEGLPPLSRDDELYMAGYRLAERIGLRAKSERGDGG